MDLKGIKNLIFDLGGVIVNIDPDKSARALTRIGSIDQGQTFEKFQSSGFFIDFEKGLIEENEFIDKLRDYIKTQVSDIEIIEAWNNMLLDIPSERIDLINKLREDFRVFFLSNTNSLHIRKVNEILEKTTGVNDLNQLAEKAYYSHMINMRKPDIEIYSHVISENKLNPSQTLFIDDSLRNIEGAKESGLKTLHVEEEEVIFRVFSNGRR